MPTSFSFGELEYDFKPKEFYCLQRNQKRYRNLRLEHRPKCRRYYQSQIQGHEVGSGKSGKDSQTIVPRYYF